MTLLNSVVLPVYSLFFSFFVLRTLVLQDLPEFMLFEMFRPGDTSGVAENIATKAEIHLMHAVGGGVLALCVNSIMAIFSGSPRDRVLATLLDLIFQFVDVYSGQSLGLPPPYPLFGIMALALVGIALEPGVFWKKGTVKKTE